MIIALKFMMVFIMVVALVGIWKTEKKKDIQRLFILINTVACAALIGCSLWL